MSASKSFRLGDLQLKILKILWERGEITVGEMHKALIREQELAYTTVATMLRKMEGRSLVSHRMEGRSFVYQPSVARDAVTQGMADHLLERLFAGSLFDMMSHLLNRPGISLEDLSKLERLIIEKKQTQ